MTADETVVAVIDSLAAAGVPYMIVGSLASNFHGIPRSTRDADFVIELPPGSLDRLRRALPPNLTLHGQGSFEAVTGTTRYLIELPGSPFYGFMLRDWDPNPVLVWDGATLGGRPVGSGGYTMAVAVRRSTWHEQESGASVNFLLLF